MNTEAYLRRINYQGPLSPTAETLRQLHVAQLQNVPFENLSIHHGEPIVLEDKALFDKVVTRRRGGFCYELNGLFAALLRELGFDVAMLAARVIDSQGEASADFDHMTLMATIGERWLADVGFGDSFVEPLLLDEPGEQRQINRSYRIRKEGDNFALAQGSNEQYRFTLRPYQYPDYQQRCLYHQTSPDSHFTKGRVCSLATPEGRITLSGMRFIRTTGDGRDEQEIKSEEEFRAMLKKHFGIEGLGPQITQITQRGVVS